MECSLTPARQRATIPQSYPCRFSGCATAAMEDGTIHELRAGTVFYIPPGPPGHDSWVVGDAPYVSLHFLGTEQYASK